MALSGMALSAIELSGVALGGMALSAVELSGIELSGMVFIMINSKASPCLLGGACVHDFADPLPPLLDKQLDHGGGLGVPIQAGHMAGFDQLHVHHACRHLQPQNCV